MAQVSRPTDFEQPPDEWDEYVPLAVDLQLHWLWYSAMDAFDMLAALVGRAAVSSLGQVRLLMEQHALVSWLVESEQTRRTRAFCLTYSEIQDLLKLSHAWTVRPESQERLRAELRRLSDKLETLASSEGILLTRRPNEARLVDTYNSDLPARYQYEVFSDTGAHVGIIGALQFFSHQSVLPIRIDTQGSALHRAYYLGIGLQYYGELVQLVARARGLGDLLAEVSAILDGQTQALYEVDAMMAAAEP
jgi:hypothetical protein